MGPDAYRPAAREDSTRQYLARLIPWLEAECAAAGLPSFALAAEGPGGPLADHVWAAGARPAARPLYRFGSLSKALTMTALLRAEAKGRLSLEMPVARLLPELRGVGGLAAARLEDLLDHRTPLALAEGDRLRGPCGRYLAPPALDEATILRTIRRRKPSAGARLWRYSDFGFALAAIALERATGRTYAQFLRQTVLAPQGLERIAAELAPLPGHVAADGAPLSMPRGFGALTPAFGLAGEVAQLNRLLHRLFAGHLLPARSMQRLYRFPHPFGPPGAGYRAGGGLFRFPVGELPAGDFCAGHQAVFGGTCGFAAHHPASGLTVSFFTNALASRPDARGRRREPNPTGLVRHIFRQLGPSAVAADPPLWRAPSVG